MILDRNGVSVPRTSKGSAVVIVGSENRQYYRESNRASFGTIVLVEFDGQYAARCCHYCNNLGNSQEINL